MMSEYRHTLKIVDTWPPCRGEAMKDLSGRWWLCCPCCGIISRCDEHTVTEHEDGTVSFSQGLECPNESCGNRYAIERSIFRYA